MTLIDAYGRPLLNLRISLTKPCNLRCVYCHAEGEEDKNSGIEMTAEEVVRISRIAVNLGITRIKLTGGEPLLRKDILEIVSGLSSIRGLEDLSMTTNGTLLAPLAHELKKCGLNRVNISLPTIDGDVYCKLTGGRLEDALEGVKAAVDAGLHPVKINMLILKDVNDSQVPAMLNFAREVGAILQLIELEPVNISPQYYMTYHKSLDEYEEMLRRRAIKVESRKFMQNRHVYHLPDVKVEVVHPIENTDFCMHCTRMRVTSDGKLKPCLMRADNLVDVLTPMRQGASDEELAKLFVFANQQRKPFNMA
ncbi:MAG: GTP 3',8-cyclase MoaA [Candidatus Bathyarchaeia archaeon]|nr:GTP 3',8-cyclase MoaA [Candidatus Bathyarchaeota archaeon]